MRKNGLSETRRDHKSMTIERVTTLEDSRLDVFCRLTSHQLRNALDPSRGIAIVESEIAIRVALEHHLEPIALLLSERRLVSMADVLEKLDPAVPVFVLPPDNAEQLTGYRVTRGALAAVRRPQEPDPRHLLQQARRVCVLEGITDTSNVGAIFRSAAALGIDAVFVAPTCADPLSRRAIRVSMGNVFLVPWAHFSGVWPQDAFDLLHQEGYYTVALALSDQSMSLDDPVLKEHERLALLFGTEGDGLTKNAIDGCDATVRIPMAHGVDSLNVAAASAVAFWELCR